MLSTILTSRNLIRELVTRDIRSRYVGSMLGLFWSILNPVMQLLLYTLVFSVFLKTRFGDDGSTARFAEFLFCALLPWSALHESATRSASAYLDNSNLIRKMQFPLETLPVSTALSALMHQTIGTTVFVIVILFTGSLHTQTVLYFPFFLALHLMFMIGLACLVATLNVFFRDIGQVIGVIFMFLFWLTPIVYPLSMVPERFLFLLEVNPLTHMVEAFRYSLLGADDFSVLGLSYWAGTSILLLVAGQWILKKSRGDILDMV